MADAARSSEAQRWRCMRSSNPPPAASSWRALVPVVALERELNCCATPSRCYADASLAAMARIRLLCAYRTRYPPFLSPQDGTSDRRCVRVCAYVGFAL